MIRILKKRESLKKNDDNDLQSRFSATPPFIPPNCDGKSSEFGNLERKSRISSFQESRESQLGNIQSVAAPSKTLRPSTAHSTFKDYRSSEINSPKVLSDSLVEIGSQDCKLFIQQYFLDDNINCTIN